MGRLEHRSVYKWRRGARLGGESWQRAGGRAGGRVGVAVGGKETWEGKGTGVTRGKGMYEA